MAKKKTNPKINKKQERLDAQAKAKRMRWMRIGGIVGIILLAIAGAAIWRNASLATAEAEADIAPPNLIGAADAPVKIVEYGDFGCHACRGWHNAGIKEQLLANFGEQISFEFRHFPVITAQSPKAAEAGECAADQGLFWEYHDYIYEQTSEGRLGAADLRAYAAAAGLDQGIFNSCLDSGRFQESVSIDWRAAQDAGARGTPTFLVNGQQAFPSLAGLSEAIENELGSERTENS